MTHLLIDGKAIREPADLSASEAGGKGSQLALLSHFGLPVPDFLIVPARWSEMRHAAFPDALALALSTVLDEKGWRDIPLAVRSSAVGEDGSRASFAGIYRSCLNVRGLDAVIRAIGEVWASLDSEGACAYRAGVGLTQAPAMAVIVMPLLDARASGIGFTCDPLSGREDRIVVHANWGFGESLVGGEAAGDEYVFAEDTSDTWREIERRLGSKTMETQAVPSGGTLASATPAARAARFVLDEAQSEALAALLRDAAVALDFVAPFFDLEWVWDGTQFWLTQARPVTRRAHHTYASLQTQPAIWTRGNTREVMPEPLQPMDWNYARRAVNDLLVQGWTLGGYHVLPGLQRAGLFHGRLYLEASIMQREGWDTMLLPPDHFNVLLGGHQPAIAVERPDLAKRWRAKAFVTRYVLRAPARRRRGEAAIARVRELARRSLKSPAPSDLAGWMAMARELSKPGREEVDIFFLQGSGGGSLSLLVQWLDKRFPGEGEAMAAAVLAGGEPSVTAQQGYDLLALARLAEKGGKQGDKDAEFARALARFIDQYGHRGHYESYMAARSWRVAPEQLLEQLPALAQVDERQLRARQKAAADEAWGRIRKALPFWRVALLRSVAKAANRETNQRELARSALIANLDALRHAWLGVAAALQGSHGLPTAEDIFWLLPSEIERIVAGALTPAGLRARVAARRTRFAQWQRETAPEFITIAPESGTQTASDDSPVASASTGALWQGVPTGTGCVRGRVRVLRHPREASRLEVGEILVAPSTDPGWTPLFLKAAGLIVETGGYLSHGAIVAREFALPAVVNLPGILDVLHDGDEVEVDGRKGSVRIIKG